MKSLKSYKNVAFEQADLRNEKIGFKIREHTLKRVPYMLVCGDQEMEAGEIAVRTRKGKILVNLNWMILLHISKLRLQAVSLIWRNKLLKAEDVAKFRSSKTSTV